MNSSLAFEQAILISIFPSAVDSGSLLKNSGDSLFYYDSPRLWQYNTPNKPVAE